MDVSAVIREVESSVEPSTMAAPVRRRGGEAPEARGERHDPPLADRAPAPPPRPRQIDPSEGVAERASLEYEMAKRHVRDANPEAGATAEELYIPGWVRITYAARARRGWFLPAPTTLAGYGEEENATEKPSE